MPYKNTLTSTQKDRMIPKIIERDGNVCFFDKQPFRSDVPGLERVIDHANNDENDHRIENELLVHRKCNEIKKTNHDFQFLALDALRKNLAAAPESLGEGEGQKRKEIGMDELTEGDVNEIINKLVKGELETKLPSGDYETVISYNKTLKGIHFLLIQQTGGRRGSEQSTRRAIDAFCSMYAPWIDEKQGKGNRIIRRRKLDEFYK